MRKPIKPNTTMPPATPPTKGPISELVVLDAEPVDVAAAVLLTGSGSWSIYVDELLTHETCGQESHVWALRLHTWPDGQSGHAGVVEQVTQLFFESVARRSSAWKKLSRGEYAGSSGIKAWMRNGGPWLNESSTGQVSLTKARVPCAIGGRFAALGLAEAA